MIVATARLGAPKVSTMDKSYKRLTQPTEKSTHESPSQYETIDLDAMLYSFYDMPARHSDTNCILNAHLSSVPGV